MDASFSAPRARWKVAKLHGASVVAAWLLAAQLFPLVAEAAKSTAPLVLQFPETMRASSGGTPPGIGVAVVGSLANASLDKQSVPQIEMFRAETEGFDFAKAVQDELVCLGVPEPRTACRPLLTLPEAKDEEELAARLGEIGVTEFVTVDVVPLLSDERFRVRAFVTEMVVTPKGLRSERSYGAIYDSRAPKDLVDAANPERLKEFWRADGRILREGQAAAQEIGDVLSFLSTNLALDSSKPAFAKAFPKIDELEAAGRIDCRGMPCSQVRVVRDQGSRLWVTATNPFGTYGAIVASLDENSAKSSVNVFGLVFGL